MLCQAILSAVAVTCTLSCIHALGQSTQRLDQIKDLMCMLILSGIQKEDLDASMLKKLQRHNVNIDYLNNEEMIKKCKDLNLQDIENKIPSPVSEHTTFKANDMITEKSKKLTKINSVLTLQRTFLNQAPHTENDNSQSNTEILPTTATADLLNKGEIEYVDGKPRLESVLKFWNNYATNKNELILVTSESPSTIVIEKKNNNNQETKRDLSKYQNPKAKDIINKVLSSFFIPRTTKDVDIFTTQNSLLNNIYKDLISSDDKPFKEAEINNKYSVDRILDAIESNYKNPLLDQNYPDLNSQEYTTNNPYISFKEMLASIDKRTAYPFAYQAIINRDQYEYFEKESKISNNFYLDNLFTANSFANKKNKKTDPPFPHNIIRDIADSVKAIILRDIRKEIQTTTSLSTTTPTTTTITTESIKSTTQDADSKQADRSPDGKRQSSPKDTKNVNESNQTSKKKVDHQTVLNKFLEFFEQIKSIKTNPIIITQNDKNVSKSQNIIENLNSATDVPSNLSQNTFLSIKYIPPNNPNIRMRPSLPQLGAYNLYPQIHKVRSNPLVRKKPIQPHRVQKAMPITIQTNALEIPPIGVFLNKPDNPISQNIIVTTISPNGFRNDGYGIYGSNFDVREPRSRFNNIYQFGNAPADTRIPAVNFGQPKYNPEQTYCSTHDCNYLINSKFSGKKFSNNKHSSKNINIDRIMEHTLDISNKKKHLNTSGFHKKLEKTGSELDAVNSKLLANCCTEQDMKMDRLSDCCIKKISSRNQMSINPIKRISYDDSHFKNFLKSQQKVTEMLERILAVKNKLRSVEVM